MTHYFIIWTGANSVVFEADTYSDAKRIAIREVIKDVINWTTIHDTNSIPNSIERATSYVCESMSGATDNDWYNGVYISDNILVYRVEY